VYIDMHTVLYILKNVGMNTSYGVSKLVLKPCMYLLLHPFNRNLFLAGREVVAFFSSNLVMIVGRKALAAAHIIVKGGP